MRRLLEYVRPKPLRVGLSSQAHNNLHTGSIWFHVSGFGPQQRSFIVDDPEKLAKNVKKHAAEVARQVATLDKALVPNVELCRPIRIDVRGNGHRRVYDLEPFKLVLEQKL